MPSTYTLISSNVLTSSAASVTFSAIPSTYTDLVLRMSVRANSNITINTIKLTANNNTSSVYSYTRLYADSGGNNIYSTRSSNNTSIGVQFADDNGNTSNTFGSIEIYIPSYTANQNKPISSFGVAEDNVSGNGGISAMASLFRSTTAISSLEIGNYSTTLFNAGSSFYLYGIKNS